MTAARSSVGGTTPSLMRRSWAAPVLRWLAARGRRTRSVAVRLALRLEGGAMFSSTYRNILSQHFGVELGAYSYGVRPDSSIAPGTSIGRYVSIGPGVRTFHRNHPLGRVSLHPFFYNRHLGFVSADTITSGSLHIGHDAWIGANAVITPAVRSIGIGAVVAAGAVVTRDVGDFEIVAGNPARPIRQRFSDDIATAVLASQWWSFEPEQLARSIDAFIGDATRTFDRCFRTGIAPHPQPTR